MVFVRADAASFFSEKTYKEYSERKIRQQNDRLRGENETIFDALLSDDADFSKEPYGNDIIKAVREYK